jgi:hypothetical protein
VFKAIIVVCKRAARVVGGINKNALDLAAEFVLKRFKGKEVIRENQPVIK